MCSDLLGDSVMWVCAFLPVWLASPGCVVVCTLVPRGPPDVYVRESGGTFGRTGPGLVLQVCSVWAVGLQVQVFSTSGSFSFRGRSSSWCPPPRSDTMGQTLW